MSRCEVSFILPEEWLRSFCKAVRDIDEETADYESNDSYKSSYNKAANNDLYGWV